jgi:hypothetical protein
MTNFTFSEKLWKYPGEKATWYFLTFDKAFSSKVRELSGKQKGWGQVKVEVTIGKTVWATSLFPGKGSVFVLPVKAAVRKAENLVAGSVVRGQFKLVGRI